MQFPRGIPLT